MARESGGKCTAYPTERRMLVAVVRAVPWPSQVENREKSRERCYVPVCSRLTLTKGTGPKGLMVTRIEAPWNAGRLFFAHFPGALFLAQQPGQFDARRYSYTCNTAVR